MVISSVTSPEAGPSVPRPQNIDGQKTESRKWIEGGGDGERAASRGDGTVQHAGTVRSWGESVRAPCTEVSARVLVSPGTCQAALREGAPTSITGRIPHRSVLKPRGRRV